MHEDSANVTKDHVKVPHWPFWCSFIKNKKSLIGGWGVLSPRRMVLCYASMWTYTKDISYVTYAILPYETDYFNPKYDLLLKLNNYFLCFNITNHRFSTVIYNLCIGWGKKNLFRGRDVTNLRKNYRIDRYSHKTAQTITMMTKF